MPEDDDIALLRRYAEEHSEEAFAELVRRHVNLVYHAALRQTGGDTTLAEDATQTVFSDLAGKAKSLLQRPVVTGWLYTSTRFAATKAKRAERRRQNREQEAHLMHELTQDSTAATDWERLRPVIDDALHALDECDREAVLLRFFEGRAFAEVGAKLSLSEDTARVRVGRALDKMHALLAKRGVTSTSAALGVALANQAGVAAPAGLAASVTGAAMVGAAASITAATKLVFLGAAALLVAGVAVFVAQQKANQALSAELTSLRARSAELARLRDENQRLKHEDAEVGALRADDAELARLQGEVTTLQVKLREAARTTATAAQTASVSGQVKRPGTLAMPTRGEILMLRELIDRAGGLTDNGKGSGIRVTRVTADGSTRIYTLDYAGEAARFKIEPDDIIYVPESIPVDVIKQALRP